MESRIQRILLTILLSTVLSLSLFSQVKAEGLSPTSQSNQVQLSQVHFSETSFSDTKFDSGSEGTGKVDVDVDRRIVLEDVLDNENFELGVQFGVMSIEDFETNPWVSVHFAYHITEFFYAKARYAQSEGGQTSFEKLVNVPPLLTDEERELSYYGLNIGYNLMPGEVFLGRDFALNSVFSIELGGGTTEFAGDEKFTVNLTANYRIFLTDWLTWDIGMSDYIFDTNITGENKTSHNLNFTTGFAYYF